MAETEKVTSETQDARLWAVGVVSVLSVLLFAIAVASVGFYFRTMQRSMFARPEKKLLFKPRAEPAPAVREPRLMENLVGDWPAYSRAAEARLHEYGWEDRRSGKVRIPIERAIDEEARP